MHTQLTMTTRNYYEPINTRFGYIDRDDFVEPELSLSDFNKLNKTNFKNLMTLIDRIKNETFAFLNKNLYEVKFESRKLEIENNHLKSQIRALERDYANMQEELRKLDEKVDSVQNKYSENLTNIRNTRKELGHKFR